MATTSASFLQLLSQRQTQFRTRQALLVFGLQDDTVAPGGNSAVVNGDSFVENIKTLVPEFRHTGDVYWIRTERQQLSPYAPQVIPLQQPHDIHLVKKHSSAFRNTSLLFNLRARLITELYLVGCFTDLCIFHTALDAAQYGIQINVIEDCLGYRSARSHTDAINRMTEELGAFVTTSNTVIDRFSPVDPSESPEAPGSEYCSSSTPDLDDDGSRGCSPSGSLSRKRRSTDLDDTSFEFQATNSAANKPSEVDTPRPTSRKKSRNIPSLANFPSKLPGDTIGSGDTVVKYDLMPPSEADSIFADILQQVRWQKMSHASGEVPRLVCYQGDKDVDGAMPVYRHPSDYLLALLDWSPAVTTVREAAEQLVGHPLNHAFIQLYRGGTDFISEHSDKSLDIVPGSSIVNVSFGAQRTMRLRSKRDCLAKKDDSSTDLRRVTERIHLPHNSGLVMGLQTNAQFLHGILADKRLPHDLSAPELAYGGLRISITFRRIGTFVSHDSQRIWGQGAVSKCKDKARPTINGDAEASKELIKAFGTENQSSNFVWEDTYGKGFDVLNMSSGLTVSEKPMLFMSGDSSDDTVQQELCRRGISSTEVPPPDLRIDPKRAFTNAVGEVITLGMGESDIAFRDTDVAHTEIQGREAVLRYLDQTYGKAV
ncbi:hypothetical protein K461DRAFT_228497 [Myriangium duriaei CBS 260.36]|uniref:Fe2OG dioxygenase domain-containing protein n=1 Tax=Myriangium duriaei CBS 260.36 TaxID=1168546 RepID=A0A9P4ML57_9PEZI|nr:hypothetical protein K461DRAFT_228497 [Myriangium duriaei CBS 260.36]